MFNVQYILVWKKSLCNITIYNKNLKLVNNRNKSKGQASPPATKAENLWASQLCLLSTTLKEEKVELADSTHLLNRSSPFLLASLNPVYLLSYCVQGFREPGHPQSPLTFSLPSTHNSQGSSEPQLCDPVAYGILSVLPPKQAVAHIRSHPWHELLGESLCSTVWWLVLSALLRWALENSLQPVKGLQGFCGAVATV